MTDESIEIKQARLHEKVANLEKADDTLFRKIDELPQKIGDMIAEKLLSHKDVQEEKFKNIETKIAEIQHKARWVTTKVEAMESTIDRIRGWWGGIVFIIALLASVLQWVTKLLFSSH